MIQPGFNPDANTQVELTIFTWLNATEFNNKVYAATIQIHDHSILKTMFISITLKFKFGGYPMCLKFKFGGYPMCLKFKFGSYPRCSV